MISKQEEENKKNLNKESIIKILDKQLTSAKKRNGWLSDDAVDKDITAAMAKDSSILKESSSASPSTTPAAAPTIPPPQASPVPTEVLPQEIKAEIATPETAMPVTEDQQTQAEPIEQEPPNFVENVEATAEVSSVDTDRFIEPPQPKIENVEADSIKTDGSDSVVSAINILATILNQINGGIRTLTEINKNIK
jgi:hypothetical protein